MSKTTKVKVIELGKTKLRPGAKYIFLLHPRYYADFKLVLQHDLHRLIGDNFIILPLAKEDFKAYEVLPNA